MSTIGYATLGIIPSMRGVSAMVERELVPQLTAAGRKTGATTGREIGGGIRRGVQEETKTGLFANIEKGAVVAGTGYGRRFGAAMRDTVGEYMKTIGGAMVGFLAFEKVKEFFTEAVSGASDLAESANKIQQIFGPASNAVVQFASTADTKLGQTELQARDAAATFGIFGKAAGLAGPQLADFSTKLDVLAGDLASFYNTSPEQAIEAIGSAMRGESEPIRQYGVLLQDATLRQEALRLGLVNTTKHALTPQQRVLAAYHVILQQTKVAQGDFARTSGGLANQQRVLAAQWKDMEAEAGQGLLPAINGLVHGANDLIPAFEGMGSAGAKAWSALPGPMHTATAAWAAFTVAQKLGLGSFVTSKVAAMSSAFDTLRLRTMMAADAYKVAREGAIELNGNIGRIVQPVGRAEAALAALRAGAIGAGAGLKGALSGAMGLIGGPWGAAFIGGTVLVTKFWEAHQEAKQHVEDLTNSLNEQTGALTKNTRETVYDSLVKSGAADAAKELGINLGTLTSAALGNKPAMAAVNAELLTYNQQTRNRGTDTAVTKITEAIGGENAALADSKRAWHDHAEAMDRSKRATDANNRSTKDSGQALMDAAKDTKTYAERIDDARHALEKLIRSQRKEAVAALQNKQDRLSLIEQMQATAKEARHGAKTLDENTKAGQSNMQALLDLANQWDNSSKAVQNADGMYQRVRQELIDDAKQMNATKGELRDLLKTLATPTHPMSVGVKTPGMDAAIARLRELRQEVRDSQNLAVYVNTHVAGDPRLSGARALGGPVVAGNTYLVGERGPELFTASQNGRIVPNGQLGGGAGPQRVQLVVGGREFDAYVREQAGSQYVAERNYDRVSGGY